MEDIKTIEGNLDASDLRIVLLASRFNDFIVGQLLDGARNALLRHGAKNADINIVWVPGAYELPMAARKLSESRRYDAIVALGCVIRGATPHFDYVAGECAKGLARVMEQYDVPIGFGVLTTDTVQQALERAGTKSGNKGADAAISAIEMANLLRRLD
ncbi:MAG: 6,7-dimethyl-8-ribityllumazine synthase [Gammaproteobacteria bacterium]